MVSEVEVNTSELGVDDVVDKFDVHGPVAVNACDLKATSKTQEKGGDEQEDTQCDSLALRRGASKGNSHHFSWGSRVAMGVERVAK